MNLKDLGTEGADLEGILYLRDVADADRLVAAMADVKAKPGKVPRKKGIKRGGCFTNATSILPCVGETGSVCRVCSESRMQLGCICSVPLSSTAG